MLPGIDISHWQPETPPLRGLAFVFARATYGTVADDRYAQHKANVLRAGLVFGAYHFGREQDGATQARAFLHTIGDDVRLVALDYERDAAAGHMTAAQARAFVREVQASGRKCGLYASAAGYPRDLGQDWCWIAKWSDTQPARPWAFWQYDGSGADRIDNDWFDGTLAQLRAMAGLEEDDMRITRVKGEDWQARRDYGLLAAPDPKAALVTTAKAGVVLRSIAEAAGADGGSWRLTEVNGTAAWFRYTNAAGAVGDMVPLVQGGDPATGAVLTAYIDRQPLATSAEVDAAYNDGLEAAAKAVAAVPRT